MKTAHDVKLLNGSKQEVSYTGVETVTMPGTDGQDKVFTAGAPIDAMDISPDFSGGDMPLEAPEGYVVRGATIKKPEGAEQVIAKGQTLAGIAGEYVTNGTSKEIEPYFNDCLVIDNPEDVSAFLSDRGNIGKYVKYVGETGDYTSGQFYKVVDEYEVFDPNSCPATAVEVTSDTVLTATLEGCKVGDLIVAAFAIRSDLVSLSDGWTLISTSKSATEINTTCTTVQTLSFAYKYATTTTEELTVTQTTAARIYLNMVSLGSASGFTDVGYQYQDNSTAADKTCIVSTRPEGKLVLWGVAAVYWSSAVWKASNDATLIQSTSSSQPRLLLAIDTSEDESVTFTNNSNSSLNVVICGALSIELEPAVHLVEVDKSEVPTTDTQTVTAEGDERWNKVVVKKPETLIPENIAKDVEIAGIIGTFEAPKVLIKTITTSGTSGIKTLFTADELETIGFASATKRFALLLDVAYNLPVSSNTYKLRANLIRYPYFGNDARGVYTRAFSVYGNRSNTYYSETNVMKLSSDPWYGDVRKNTMYYADGAILYDLSSTYVLDAGAVVIVGCY